MFYLLYCHCCSVAQWWPTLCDPVDCSTPGLPVLHCLPEFAQIHVHWVSDAISPSHPLLLPSPFAFNLSQHQRFSSESVLCIRWPKYWSFSFSISPSNGYSASISFRIDSFDLFAVQGTLKSSLVYWRRMTTHSSILPMRIPWTVWNFPLESRKKVFFCSNLMFSNLLHEPLPLAVI